MLYSALIPAFLITGCQRSISRLTMAVNSFDGSGLAIWPRALSIFTVSGSLKLLVISASSLSISGRENCAT